MPLTVAEQAVLTRKYEPHLVLFFKEDFGRKYIAAPIDPDTYIRRCGLWADTSTPQPDKTNWGVADIGHQDPNNAPGTLEPEPSLVTADKTRLKDALADVMATGAPSAFLSHGGWLEKSPFAPVDIDPNDLVPGLVTADTQNRFANLHHNAHLWTERTFEPPPFPGGEGPPSGDPFVSPPRYTAEAFDRAALEAALPDSIVNMLPMNMNQHYFILYHYFFPTHDALLKRCEMIALMHEFGVEIPDDKIDAGVNKLEQAVAGSIRGESYPDALQDLIGALADTGAHFSLPFATYAGDFVSVAVVVKAPVEGTGGELISPLDAPDALFEPPEFVGFGKKAYAVTETTTGAQVVQVPVVDVFTAGEIEREGLHPLVFVSDDANQTYSGAEQSVGPLGPSGSKTVEGPGDAVMPTLCEVADVNGNTEVPNTGEHKRRYRVAVSLAKIGAGLASGGGLGVLIGAAAALLEGLLDAGDDTEPDLDPLPRDDRDSIPLGVDGHFVIRSEETRETFGDSGPNFTYWPDDTASMVVDPADPPDWFRQPNLRFGVPALADPLNHRSGKPQPDFLPVTIDALGTRLAEPE